MRQYDHVGDIMNEKVFRPLVCFLLAGILAMQIFSMFYTMQNKPVTYGDLINAKQADQKKQLRMKTPIVNAKIDDTISVDITNEPLSVNVESMP